MPERPDLEWVVPRLDELLRGRRIVDVVVRKPVVLRCLATEVRGLIHKVERRLHFLRFTVDDRELVFSPMLAGRFQLDGRTGADLALSLVLDQGVLHYRDDVQMGKVYWIAAGDLAAVPGLAEAGIDVLGPDFDRARFREIARGRRDHLKTFLMDRSALDAMGNAYADEVLWAARLHPRRAVRELGPDELDRLHDAIVETLGTACATIRERAPPLPEKLRDFLHVRGRKGEPCDRCGATLRTAGVHGHDAFFCPTCQPDLRGRGLVDWRKLPGS